MSEKKENLKFALILLLYLISIQHVQSLNTSTHTTFRDWLVQFCAFSDVSRNSCMQNLGLKSRAFRINEIERSNAVLKLSTLAQ